jgi:hypothetical protein
MAEKVLERLRETLDPKIEAFTIADAAAASGLSLAEAERGLHALTSEYRGHLRVTEDGDILFRFPHGFTKPWETQDALTKFWTRIKDGAAGALRFIVRAWVAIVLVGYVAIFIALAIAIMFAGKSEDRGSSREGGSLAGVLIRLVLEALYWTFHPFSPFAVASPVGYSTRGFGGRYEQPKSGSKFYETVDRFFFGPKPPKPDEDEERKAVLAEIRAGLGRIGLADVMRVTGKSRDEIDPLMSRLLVDYGGSIEVSEEGGIAYRFPDLRKTATTGPVKRKPAVWSKAQEMPPVTGNAASQNFLIFLLNAFNLGMSAWVVSQGATLGYLAARFSGTPPELMPPPGTPLVLGWIPLVFSIALFALPLGRLAMRPFQRRRVAKENGRRAVLKTVIENAKGGVAEKELVERYRIASGETPSEAEIMKEVRALGGDVDVERAAEGIRYRFPDLELEAKAVEAEREAASEEEAKVGKIVFSSEN